MNRHRGFVVTVIGHLMTASASVGNDGNSSPLQLSNEFFYFHSFKLKIGHFCPQGNSFLCFGHPPLRTLTLSAPCPIGTSQKGMNKGLTRGGLDYHLTVEVHKLVRGKMPGSDPNIVTICCACKKIKEMDRWQLIENYVRDHAGVVFSHGICPECRDAIYPELKGIAIKI